MRYNPGMSDAAIKTFEVTSANDTVAGNIRAELARSGSRPADLARALGENEMWLSRRLASKVAFSTNEVQAIADILDVEVGYLFSKPRRLSDSRNLVP